MADVFISECVDDFGGGVGHLCWSVRVRDL